MWVMFSCRLMWVMFGCGMIDSRGEINFFLLKFVLVSLVLGPVQMPWYLNKSRIKTTYWVRVLGDMADRDLLAYLIEDDPDNQQKH